MPERDSDLWQGPKVLYDTQPEIYAGKNRDCGRLWSEERVHSVTKNNLGDFCNSKRFPFSMEKPLGYDIPTPIPEG